MLRKRTTSREPQALVMGEHRMKYREDRVAHWPPSASIAPPSTSAVPQSSSPMDKSTEKAITMGRKLNFNFLLQEGFQVGELMKRMT